MMTNNNILISGAGIAGMTLAYWLHKFGFNPTIIEQHNGLRKGGYMIDFFGTGVTVADRMNILPLIANKDARIPEVTFVDEMGTRKGGLAMVQLRKLIPTQAFTILRDDLSDILFSKIKNHVDVVFGHSIEKIDQDDHQVNVTFNGGKTVSFDLLIAADGLHSNVRNLIFGRYDFQKFCGYYTASYLTDNYINASHAFLSHNVPQKHVGLYSIRNNKLATFFLFKSKKRLEYDRNDIESQKQILVKEFQGVKWECPTMLKKLSDTNDLYFDEVSQVNMGEWYQNRVSFIGDACYCPSLLSGQGATMAMVGAYVLAGELRLAQGDYKKAFAEYQKIVRPLASQKQEIALKTGSSFLPDTKFGVWFRNTFSNIIFLPIISSWFAKTYFSGELKLKIYESFDPLPNTSKIEKMEPPMLIHH
jgi:2-polyprenyl-6-methoxyphenol hydroxylase-like FAD-dependent oxidoreductase